MAPVTHALTLPTGILGLPRASPVQGTEEGVPDSHVCPQPEGLHVYPSAEDRISYAPDSLISCPTRATG